MKIKQPKTTTIAPYFNEFYFEDDHSVPSYENELQFLFDYEATFEDFGKNTLAYYQFLGILDDVYKYATYFSFCVNLFHLFILTRKELRTNLVYIIMIGICLCDLVQSLANIFQYVLLWNIVYKIDQCYDGYKYSHVVVNLMAKTTQIMSRRCSSVLALYLGGIRAFSIIEYPNFKLDKTNIWCLGYPNYHYHLYCLECNLCISSKVRESSIVSFTGDGTTAPQRAELPQI
ncbi:hypothetical protein L5515_006791 [Caenorhabditis briggsae]|uniref:G-protein coupled receptors family 1 profile domain-containing protein n=1 Tax=Caenorhabditis briggsae TaxID=6238 RepID=A0AAE9F594_CAEBR|nr:hypothetical protein L5515_006791 [Caenorhabditis briggsae]